MLDDQSEREKLKDIQDNSSYIIIKVEGNGWAALPGGKSKKENVIDTILAITHIENLSK